MVKIQLIKSFNKNKTAKLRNVEYKPDSDDYI